MDGAAITLRMLASGSSGNATILSFGAMTHRVVMIDAGISPKRVRDGMLQHCAPGSDLGAILLTHLDGDHWYRGWEAQLRRRPIPVLMRAEHARGATAIGVPPNCIRVIDGSASLGHHLRVTAVRTPHDEYGSTAFVIDSDAGRVAWATDLGQFDDALVDALAGVHLLGLECNYDDRMQRDSPRPWHLKQRIMGGRGHLSNEQAMDALERLASRSPLSGVALIHLSRDCNCPHLVGRLLESRHPALAARTVIARRSRPSPALHLHHGATRTGRASDADAHAARARHQSIAIHGELVQGAALPFGVP